MNRIYGPQPNKIQVVVHYRKYRKKSSNLLNKYSKTTEEVPNMKTYQKSGGIDAKNRCFERLF